MRPSIPAGDDPDEGHAEAAGTGVPSGAWGHVVTALRALSTATDADAVVAIVRAAARAVDAEGGDLELSPDRRALVWRPASSRRSGSDPERVLAAAGTLALGQVAERRALESRLRRQEARLDATSREVETFSSAVAHDVQSPICAVGLAAHTFVTGLRDRDARADRFLTGVSDLTTRMNALVSDLHTIARFSRAPLSWGPIDLGVMARDAVRRLRAGEPGRAVTVEIAPGLTAFGDAALVRTAVDHLLSNAWKYSSRRPHATIDVGQAEAGDDGRTFVVRDNGVGFDMKHADRLFVPFSRLHASSDFAGRGLGLAVVRRIVHRHGGRVWAEAAVDGGAAFFLTLPDSAEAAGVGLER